MTDQKTSCAGLEHLDWQPIGNYPELDGPVHLLRRASDVDLGYWGEPYDRNADALGPVWRSFAGMRYSMPLDWEPDAFAVVDEPVIFSCFDC